MKSKEEFTQLDKMRDAFMKARKEILPSKYWIALNEKNYSQLKGIGYNNFKRTIALNYFTWIPKKIWRSDQLKYLFLNLPLISTVKNFLYTIRALFLKRQEIFTLQQSFNYSLLTYMIWDLALRDDNDRILKYLSEPIEGNPPKLYRKKKLISQDFANSFLEYKSIMSKMNKEEINTILELGPGYGRTSFIFLKLIPNLKYILVDIPPALYIAERYLTNQFKNKKIFKFRNFDSFNEIKEEFEQSDISFFLPTQLKLLPPKIADLFINISSLHEMRKDQIDFYFKCIDKLIKKYVYIKQWKRSPVRYENIVITEKDYPIRENWKNLFWRGCKVQSNFFEALFKL